MPSITLSPEQSAALAAVRSFLSGPDTFLTISGPAGTGKTTLMRELAESLKGRLVFTAPTNKATKVLRDLLTTDDYKPECRTTFSLLGLKLEATGEVKELVAPEDPLDLSKFVAVVVDEGSMVSAQLFKFIGMTAENYSCKFIFLGDPAQLPPVKETRSAIWAIDGPKLTKVMRHDNQILSLATRIREALARPVPVIKLTSDHDAEQGVWHVAQADFAKRIVAHAGTGAFQRPDGAKAIAWRNITVNALNALIREAVFPGINEPFVVGDRVLFAAPGKDIGGKPSFSTDDEGTVQRVSVELHPIYRDFSCFRLTVLLDDNRLVTAWSLHPEAKLAWDTEVSRRAEAAKLERRKWKSFWEFKEAFHEVRYAYALTAHRAQGSTYNTAFVDYHDILCNQNRQEAFRCLYVACTRPRRALVLA